MKPLGSCPVAALGHMPVSRVPHMCPKRDHDQVKPQVTTRKGTILCTRGCTFTRVLCPAAASAKSAVTCIYVLIRLDQKRPLLFLLCPTCAPTEINL